MTTTALVADLNPHEKNARRHPEGQITALANAIKEWGWTIPILVDSNNTVLAGHARLEAAKRLGLVSVPVIVAEGWSEQQKRAYIIADNQLADASTWNSVILKEELQSIAEAGWDLNLVGFDDSFLNIPEVKSKVRLPSREDPFLVPRSTVLSARGGAWRQRRDEWMAIGLRSEVGRADNLTFAKSVQSVAVLDQKASYEAMIGKKVSVVEFLDANPHVVPLAGTSIFDPTLCEAMYRWFCPEGGVILDPFAGGSVRGIVASLLGYNYIGQDLREEQVAENREQATAIIPQNLVPPLWIVGDSRKIKETADGVVADMVFSCPPYADLEVYSDDPNDLSTLGYQEFIPAYQDIITATCSMLKDGGFAVFVVGEVRSPSGDYLGFVPDTIRAFEQAGLALVSHGILVTPVNSLPARAGKPFQATRKVGKTHQNVLVFLKGELLESFNCGSKAIELPVVHEQRKIWISAAWASKKFNCTVSHILDPQGCGGGCCTNPKFWPPSSGNSKGCSWLGESGCTMAWDDKPYICNLYPLVLNKSDKIVLHHRSQFPTSTCKKACGSGPLLIDACASGLISIFGEPQYKRVRADVASGKDSYFITSPEIATAIERELVWEKHNISPRPMSEFAHLFTEEERKKPD